MDAGDLWAALSLLEGLARSYGAAQSHCVCVLQAVSEAKASGQGSHFDSERRNLPVQIEGCGFALDVAGQGEDNLKTLRVGVLAQSLKPVFQKGNAEVRRTYAVYWGDDAAQDVIYAMILAGVLDAHDILHILHYAYLAMVALGVGADAAAALVGYHAALAAVAYIVTEVVDGLGEMVYIFFVLPEKMQG